jgi:putative addiction module component (TIGR02574 family)
MPPPGAASSSICSATPALFLDEALTLPAKARAKLAAELLRSLYDEDDAELDQAEYDAAWGEEIARRVKELDDGVVEAVPWEEARRRIASTDDGSHSG